MNLSGVNITGVKAELEAFVRETTPKSLSTMTARTVPTCGRQRAIELTERVIPILDRLYTTWRDENPGNVYFEFKSERDACSRLLARVDSHEDISGLFAGQDDAPQLSASKMHELVWRAASAQWSTGHRHEAVLAAAKAVNSRLQAKLDRRDLSEAKLIRDALSETQPKRPRLRFPDVADDQTRESIRQGVLAFGTGCFQAIRNPIGHLPNDQHDLDEQSALEQLAALSLLTRWIDQAVVEQAT